MEIILKNFEKKYTKQTAEIWNEVVEEASFFPGEKTLSEDEAEKMFFEQTETICALLNDKVVGVYILHPNNFGRCGHIANASYAIKREYRGKGIGRKIVSDCLQRAKNNGFKGLQFNAVVSTNYTAIALYLKLGFTIIGTIKNGYRLKDDSFVDTLIFLKSF